MRVYERSEELRRKDERQTLAVEMVAIHLTAVFMVQYSARLRSTAQHIRGRNVQYMQSGKG